MIIIPSVLEREIVSLDKCLRRLLRFYHHFQIDIADGHFVPNKTLQISHYAAWLSNEGNSVNPVIFDFHLMVSDPEIQIELIEKLPKNNVGIVLIHKSVFPPLQPLIAKHPNILFGLVLNPEDEVVATDSELLKALPIIQIMTVTPGKQGQPFIENVLQKIEQLRKRGFQGKIYIDGAINRETLPLIMSHINKPDVLCPGSYLVQSPEDELQMRVDFLKASSS